MTVRIEPCSDEQLAALLSMEPSPRLAQHHRERFALQIGGLGVYLLAWRGTTNVGRTTLYAESKYAEVRRRYPNAAEINALEAFPQKNGTGTALIVAAGEVAADRGHSHLGLAVEPRNPAARRLYEHLGYQLWDGPQVVDTWTELCDDGTSIHHQTPCDYLIKPARDLPR